jgi:GNAT superfamily N-acetyltransferase
MMTKQVIRYSERPELRKDTATITREVSPEYNLHSEDPNGYWGRLFDEFPEFQFLLYDAEQHEVIAEGHTLPCDWDGTPDGLGDGIDAIIAEAFKARQEGRRPTALCALAAEVRPRFQGGGLANRMLDVMSDLARDAGLAHLIAPVRPSLKDRYPISPIEQYVGWTRETGEPFDPWIRLHDPPRRADRQADPPLDAHHRHGSRVGGVDRDALPRRRAVHLPSRSRPGRDRPRARPRVLLGAQRLDRTHARLKGVTSARRA